MSVSLSSPCLVSFSQCIATVLYLWMAKGLALGLTNSGELGLGLPGSSLGLPGSCLRRSCVDLGIQRDRGVAGGSSVPQLAITLYRSYYPHRSRDSLSPVCGIFLYVNPKTKFFIQKKKIFRPKIIFFNVFKKIFLE